MQAAATFLSIERDNAPGHVIVLDGFGNEVPVFRGEKKSFPVKLDMEGCFMWRSMDNFGAGGVAITQKTRATKQETNFIEVHNEDGPVITFQCFMKQSAVMAPAAAAPQVVTTGTAAPPIFAAATPQVQVSQEAFSASRAPQPQLHEVPDAATRQSTRSLHEFLQEEPNLRMACLVGGVAVVVYSLLAVINIFSFFSNKTYYIVHAYLVFFGAVTCVTEMHPSIGEGPHKVIQKTQDWMHEWAEGLTTLWGRGLFYLFQGSLIAVSSDAMSLGMVVSVYMIGLGLFCIMQASNNREFHAQEDYIRIAPAAPAGGRMGQMGRPY